MNYSMYITIVRDFIDLLGVITILAGVLISLIYFILTYFRQDFAAAFAGVRENLGRTILIGLELLIAGDIIGSIAMPPTLSSVGVLAIIVLIRSFLSIQIEKEIKWSHPWKHLK